VNILNSFKLDYSASACWVVTEKAIMRVYAVKVTQTSTYPIPDHFVTPVKYRRAIFGNADREHKLVEFLTSDIVPQA
jgi:hypothetical protein